MKVDKHKIKCQTYKVRFNEGDIAEAEYYAKQMQFSVIPGQSTYRDDEPENINLIGYLGEMAVKRCFEHELHHELNKNEYNSVFKHGPDEFDFKLNELKLDVKSGHMHIPYEKTSWKGYRFMVANKNMNKPIDYYILVQISPDMNMAYIMGYISKKNLMKCDIIPKGGLVVKECYAGHFDKLGDIKNLIRNKLS